MLDAAPGSSAMNANEQLLYALQEKTVLSQQQEMPSMLGQPDCIDAWRKRRMYALIRPIVAYGIQGRWLTIGDSGSDATTLAESGVAPGRIRRLLALHGAARAAPGPRYIPGVGIQTVNAERIDAPADAFDFVFAKEVYHHLPRPSIGLDQMLRVAREAVVLISDRFHRAAPRPAARSRQDAPAPEAGPGRVRVLRQLHLSDVAARDPEADDGDGLFGHVCAAVQRLRQ